jgi:uncharacterized membrane protein YccF (DUF307 family)
MSCLGNVLWFLLGGMLMGFGWALVGALWCITIVGIPIGLQCFKFAPLPSGRSTKRLFTAAGQVPCF